MTADDIRHLYDYHFALNRRLWDRCIVPLDNKPYTRKLGKSVGSVRNQMVHLMNMDQRWFCGLRQVEVPGLLNPVHFSNRDKLRQQWGAVEAEMREYLNRLQDADLHQPYGENMQVWQVLFHVLNHGTDHRAQTLAMLNELGVQTWPQDYVLFVAGKL